MSKRTEDLLRDALRLPENQRAELVAGLLESLEPGVPTLARSNDEWVAEVERRARKAIAGAPGIPWEEARGQLRGRLSKK